MKILKTDFIEGARQARGVVVIIDVFRAFSVACYCFMRGAGRIIAVGEVEAALRLREHYPGALLIGERGGRKLAGFDFGNSPTEIMAADLQGRTLIHTTHAGTQGIVNATGADEILTGSLVNAMAVAHYIRDKKPEVVTLVRMGLEASSASDEDNICADYLESLLRGKPLEREGIRQFLTASPFSARFFDPAIPWNPESDFHYCLNIDAFDAAIRASRNGLGDLELRPV
ncbi:MAG: 2-phosphosulfolactate phosphatase [Pseudomonadales bacterium]|nr:2-phosphosulfolactate phosphatase [Pseudomonadales bacterium]